jgi:pilus assembly protein CpaB
MRRGPLFMLVAAFLCAAAAALLARSWMTSQSGSVVTVKQETPAAVKTVIAAARDIKPGDKITPEFLKEVQWPEAAMPAGAFTNKDAVLKAAGPHGVYTKVWTNLPLLPQHFSQESQDGLLSGRIDGAKKAMSLRVSDVAGVAGFVQPEDHVDVLLTAAAGGQGDASQLPASATTRTILRNVRVLATDQQTQRKTPSAAPKTVTVEVNSVEAAKLTLAMTVGQLSLVLNRPDSGGEAEGPMEAVRAEDLLSGTPVAGSAGAPNVTVTRSVERKDYRVLPESQ